MKNQSKAIKNIIAVVALFAMTVYGTKYMSTYALFCLVVLLLVITAFNFTVRNLPVFKPYFLSPFNFLCTKTLIEKQLDLPKEILVEKFSEVLTDAGFTVKNTDRQAGTLFATSGLTWKSWGENIYIEFDDAGTGKFYSVGVMGVYSWGLNDCNLRKLANSFESSLTI